MAVTAGRSGSTMSARPPLPRDLCEPAMGAHDEARRQDRQHSSTAPMAAAGLRLRFHGVVSPRHHARALIPGREVAGHARFPANH